MLVARIELCPDELTISEASLYRLQIAEAAQFLDKAATDKTLKLKESWDGSVVSLLNYPEIVKMMSDGLDWTLGDAPTLPAEGCAGRHPVARQGGCGRRDQER